MSSIKDEIDFIAEVKKNVTPKSEPQANARSVFVGKVLFVFGFLFVVVGVGLAIVFISVMESTYLTLGGSEVGGIVQTALNSGEEAKSAVLSAGLGWIPTFMKIYSIRWIITLGIVGLTAAIALIFFSLAYKRKDTN